MLKSTTTYKKGLKMMDEQEDLDSASEFGREEDGRIVYSTDGASNQVEDVLSEMVETMQDEDELEEFGGAGEVAAAYAQRIHEAVEALLLETESRLRAESEAKLAEAESRLRAESEAKLAEAESRLRAECEAKLAEAESRSDAVCQSNEQPASAWQDECVNRCFSLLDAHVKTLVAEAKELAVLEYIEKNRG